MTLGVNTLRHVDVHTIARVLEDVGCDVAKLFMAVEDARSGGFNMVYLHIGVGNASPAVEFACIAFEYSPLTDTLTPLAILIDLGEKISLSTPLDKLFKLVAEVGGYIYGAPPKVGILIPVDDAETLRVHVIDTLPRLFKVLLGKNVSVNISGYSVDLSLTNFGVVTEI